MLKFCCDGGGDFCTATGERGISTDFGTGFGMGLAGAFATGFGAGTTFGAVLAVGGFFLEDVSLLPEEEEESEGDAA